MKTFAELVTFKNAKEWHGDPEKWIFCADLLDDSDLVPAPADYDDDRHDAQDKWVPTLEIAFKALLGEHRQIQGKLDNAHTVAEGMKYRAELDQLEAT